MKSNWYCGVEGQQYGPYTWEQLRAMAVEGRIISDSFVRRDVDQQWFQAAQVPGLLPKASSAALAEIGSNGVPPIEKPKAAIAAGSSDSPKSSTKVKTSKPRAPASPAYRVAGQAADRTEAPPVVAPPAAFVPSSKAADSGVFPQIAIADPPRGHLGKGQRSAPAASTQDPGKSGIQHAATLPVTSQATKQLMIGGAMAGVLAVLMFVGIAMAVITYWPKKESEKQLAGAADQAMQDSMQELAAKLQKDPPANLAEAAAALEQLAPELEKALDEAGGALPAESAPAAATEPVTASTAESQAVLKSQKQWRDIIGAVIKLSNGVNLRVTSVWMAADEAGTRIEPVVDSSGTSATIDEAKYVFVEVEIANGAAVARKYASWNAAGASAAILGDHNDEVLEFVPPSTTPGASRLASVDIPPGESISDVLVFQAPQGSVEKLHLALALSAIARNARVKDYIALEIPLESLLAQTAPADAADPAAAPPARVPLAANPAMPLDPDAPPPLIIEGADLPQGGPAPPKPIVPKKVEPPVSREDINKAFEELSKPAGGPAVKKGEPEKKKAKPAKKGETEEKAEAKK